jgi:hypothetical protein
MKGRFFSLWFWVVLAFVALIFAWMFTVRLAREYQNPPLKEGEVLTRQTPAY